MTIVSNPIKVDFWCSCFVVVIVVVIDVVVVIDDDDDVVVVGVAVDTRNLTVIFGSVIAEILLKV